jgi:intracellular septation protein A
MKTKEILRRMYYALTSGALVLALITILSLTVSYGHYNQIHPVRFPIIITIFALLFCWIMSRHNKRDGYILIAVIALTGIIGLAQHLSEYFQWYVPYKSVDALYIPSVSIAIILVSSSCMMIAGFVSETKYNNILPNQSKAVAKIFRIISWVGQIIVWGLAILNLSILF